MLNFFNNLDETILLWIHHNHNTILNQLMPIITNVDNWVIPILFFIFFSDSKEKKRENCTCIINHISVIN